MTKSFTLNNTSDSILSRICLVSLIWLLLVLGGFSTRAWGAEYISYTGTDSQAWTSNGAVIYETGVFVNTIGIDQISYTYNSYKSDKGNPPADGLIVEYSLDGTTYTEWSRKDGGSNVSVTDAIPANHPARNAVRFRFKARGVYGWHAIWSLRIRKTTYTATITKRSNSDSDWSRIQNSGTSSAYITCTGNDAGQHATFRLSGGTFDYYTTFATRKYYYFRSTNDQTHTVSWTVDAGYTIYVSEVSLMVRASLNKAEIKVGQAAQVTNPYDEDVDDFYPVSSGAYSPTLGNNGNVAIKFDDFYSTTNNFIHTLTVDYYIANNYKVSFSANGGSGSMSDQNFVYGTAQNLTSNTFTRDGYTVTYDANSGSCGIASSTTDYTFEGWATSSDGDKVYDDAEEVNNLTTTANGTVNLFAKWISPSAVTLPTPTRDGYIFAGWYDQNENRIGGAGDSYTPTADITLKAHWTLVASSADNDSDIKDGKIVIKDKHATFTIAGTNAISFYNDKWEGYKLVVITSVGTETFDLSWESNDDSYIKVTKVEFDGRGYHWAAGALSNGTMTFNDVPYKVFSIAITANDADWTSISASADSLSSGIPLVCNVTKTGGISPYFTFYIRKINITYTVTPNAPTPHDANLDATLSESAKQTLDVRVGSGALFTMSSPAADFEYAYRLKEDYANAHLEDGYFWATAAGDYEIQARVTSADDHEASAWSTCTVHVTRTCVFNNTTGDKEWGTTDNWAYSITPNSTDAVRVLGNLTIDEQIEMLSLSIEGAAVVEIAPTGGLTVGAGGISGADAEKLILKAGTAGATQCQTGYLRISPDFDGDMPEAKVEMFTIAYHNKNAESGSKSFYQCMGAPISDAGVMAKTVFGAGSWLYTWNESTEDWTNSRTSYSFVPFKGFEVTQKKSSTGLLYTHTGHVVSGSDVKTIDLEYTSAEKGYNLLANSWTAPIDISQFESEDFVDAVNTIYILNAGTKNQSDANEGGIDAPGKWFGVPIKTAAELAAEGLPRVIPSMQGFWVKANSGSAQLKLDYSRLVWDVDYSGYTANKPLRAPKRTSGNEDAPITGKLKVSLYSESENDCFFMLESERYDAAYEDGYDAMKIPSGSMDVFTIEGENELGVDATNSIIGTRVGVRTGEETAYTLEFSRFSAENELALRDNETNEEIDIYEGMQYTFFAEPNATLTERFEIVEREAPSITTGVDNADTKVKVHKFIKDNQVLILKNGVLYNTMGATVR